MPVLYKDCGLCRIESVCQVNKSEKGWVYRKGYEGMVGNMKIYRQTANGRFFAYIESGCHYLCTGLGKISITDDTLTVSTENSLYVFKKAAQEVF